MSAVTGHKDRQVEREEGHSVLRGWLIVIAIALAVVANGLLMFFTIGDKGPPDWDFGNVEDIPGQSIYSTNPAIPGPAGIPQPQHVNEKPALVGMDAGKKK